MKPANDEPRPESPAPVNPGCLMDDLLNEAELRRQREAEDRREAEERARRLKEYIACRNQLEVAFYHAESFPTEEKRQGQKPDPDGFRRWAEKLIETAALMRKCETEIEGLKLVELLKTAVARPMPEAPRCAVTLLLLASEEQADVVALALEKAYGDTILRRFAGWLPCILESLWPAYIREGEFISVPNWPDPYVGRQVMQAFGRLSPDLPEAENLPPTQLLKNNKPDGPFDPTGFRFAGVEVKFGKAHKQYLLVLALWDSKEKKLAPSRSIEDVMSEVWGEEHDTEDSAFRQLCADVRRRFEAENFPLTIKQINGKVQLSSL